ncbi:hypothetical protein EDD18DRAFT_1359814 [Armillaria luteobubalina]|uniref:Secreted protein n=1 Tax=Armillaria luteobubalina TaxID=153913 RepID=A0AA39PQV1_9AGAR|nr:hypothetical protein EDD18DRAFT_1359814 [Armillaria luteobubalina]
MVKLFTKFSVLSLAIIAPIVSAIDIQLCDDAYYINCDWKYHVPIGKCLNSMVSDGWAGFTDNITNTGGCGICYYFANDHCYEPLFNSSDATLDWFAGYNDQLSSIFCSQNT